MSRDTRYDDALPRFAALVRDVLGAAALEQHLFLRDAEGRLTFVVRNPHSPGEDVERLRAKAAEALAPYVTSATGSVATPEEMFDPSLERDDAGSLELLCHDAFQGTVRVVERRVLGQDWLSPPEQEPPTPGSRIVVFASHKGGVGRSTALAVAASDLAARGGNVLVVDLDLESPGAGEVLLASDEVPEFGALDFFVENGLDNLDEGFFSSLVGRRASPAAGTIDVVPAVGARSRAHPHNVLGKLGRAYLEDADPSGKPRSLLLQTRDLLRELTRRRTYSAVLVDARAGLNESTASAILGLGADILLFGMDTPQTFQGYRYLLSHLRRFVPATPQENDFRLRLRMVHARASTMPEAQAAFRDRAFELFADYLYEAPQGEATQGSLDLFNFDLDDLTAPHYAWPILDDASYREFDPLSHPEMLLEPVYARTFGKFLDGLRARVEGKG